MSVTSVGHRAVKGMYWDDLQLEHGWTAPRAYGQSKLGQILFGREIARRYGGLGVVAHAAHPGVVRSNFAADGDTHGIQKLTVRAFSAFGVSPSTGARPRSISPAPTRRDNPTGATGLAADNASRRKPHETMPRPGDSGR